MAVGLLRITPLELSFHTYAMSRATIILALLLSGSTAACNRSGREPRSNATTSAPGAVVPRESPVEPRGRTIPVAYVDSALPTDEALRRFRAGLGAPQAALAPAFHSREALVRKLVEVVERSDTLGLVPLVLSRAEFAYLYYPTNPLSKPPYALAPELMWFRLQESNRRAAFALIHARGGMPLDYLGHECAHSERQGDNTIWSDCEVRHRVPTGSERRERLFGTIIERNGRYKFVGLSNALE